MYKFKSSKRDKELVFFDEIDNSLRTKIINDYEKGEGGHLCMSLKKKIGKY